MLMTEPLFSSPEWQSGGHLAAQEIFAPMLQQRFEQANSMGRLAMVTDKVGEVKGLMNENIQVLLENHDRVEVRATAACASTSRCPPSLAVTLTPHRSVPHRCDDARTSPLWLLSLCTGP